MVARLAYAPAVARFITPKGNTATMHYRLDTNDWNTINASMTADEYGLRDLQLSGLAVDIGAYVGSVGIALALDNPGLRVICIEPVPENIELIRQNIVANRLTDKITAFFAGAAAPDIETTAIRWRYRGSVTADHHAFVGNTTLVEGSGATDVEFDELKLGCISLSMLIKEYGAIDFLKIDCEGCEWSVLTDPAVANIPLVVGEWHPNGGHMRADLLALLSTHNVTFSGPEAGPGGFKAVRREA